MNDILHIYLFIQFFFSFFNIFSCTCNNSQRRATSHIIMYFRDLWLILKFMLLSHFVAFFTIVRFNFSGFRWVKTWAMNNKLHPTYDPNQSFVIHKPNLELISVISMSFDFNWPWSCPMLIQIIDNESVGLSNRITCFPLENLLRLLSINYSDILNFCSFMFVTRVNKRWNSAMFPLKIKL